MSTEATGRQGSEKEFGVDFQPVAQGFFAEFRIRFSVKKDQAGADFGVLEAGVAQLRRNLIAAVTQIGNCADRCRTIEPVERFAHAGFQVKIVAPRIGTTIAGLRDLTCLGGERCWRIVRRGAFQKVEVVIKLARAVTGAFALILADPGDFAGGDVTESQQPGIEACQLAVTGAAGRDGVTRGIDSARPFAMNLQRGVEIA